jgi:hypothetical protein
MYIRVPVGLALALGFIALGSTEAAAQKKSKTPIVVKNYYLSPNAMYYAAPPAAKAYVAPAGSYYSAPPAVSTYSSPPPSDLPASSPGYQGSWRNSRF